MGKGSDTKFEIPFFRYLEICRMDPDSVYTNIMHSHFCLEMIYVFSGCGYMKTTFGEIPLKQGDFLLVDRGVFHTEYSSEKEKMCFYCLQLSGVSFRTKKNNNGFCFFIKKIAIRLFAVIFTNSAFLISERSAS